MASSSHHVSGRYSSSEDDEVDQVVGDFSRIGNTGYYDGELSYTFADSEVSTAAKSTGDFSSAIVTSSEEHLRNHQGNPDAGSSKDEVNGRTTDATTSPRDEGFSEEEDLPHSPRAGTSKENYGTKSVKSGKSLKSKNKSKNKSRVPTIPEDEENDAATSPPPLCDDRSSEGEQSFHTATAGVTPKKIKRRRTSASQQTGVKVDKVKRRASASFVQPPSTGSSPVLTVQSGFLEGTAHPDRRFPEGRKRAGKFILVGTTWMTATEFEIAAGRKSAKNGFHTIRVKVKEEFTSLKRALEKYDVEKEADKEPPTSP